MAEHLAQIFGTEKDKINCPFYYKIGACRHGERCSRTHNKPLFSQTLLFTNLYVSPLDIAERAKALGMESPVIPDEENEYYFEDFYADVHGEMSRFGLVDGMVVCENRSEHLAGNTYVKFADEDSAKAALAAMSSRYYAGRPVMVEFSPVTELNDGRCRKFEEEVCERGDYCHFMHTRRLSDDLYRRLYPKRPRVADREWDRDREGVRDLDRTYRERDGYGERERNRERTRDREPDRDHGANRIRDRERSYDYGRERSKLRDRNAGGEAGEHEDDRDQRYDRNDRDSEHRRSSGRTRRADANVYEIRRDYDRDHGSRRGSYRSSRGTDADRHRDRR
jgi:splicing factor U2AF 35 kDa subunit